MTPDTSVLFSSINEIGRRYRSGDLTSVRVTEMCLARIEALNPTLNAFLTVTPDDALEAAATADDELRRGHDRGALHGIPIALKDLIDTVGTPTTCGSIILRDNVPGQDAVIVRNLRSAGAVIVGKTNMLEFAYGIVHPDVGQTWNPWNTTRTAGGSSGGSAAAVAAGMCYAAVGTDTGGSIRVPAAYCGVAGLKPTYDLVSLEGIFPLSWSLDHAGPLARSSHDAALMLDALCGRRPQPLQPRRDITNIRMGLLTAHFEGDEMQAAVRDLCFAACDRLAQFGMQFVPVEVEYLDLADGLLLTLAGPEASLIHDVWLHERPQDYAPLTRQQLELGYAVPVSAYLRAQQFRRLLAARMMAVFEQVDALISPTVAWAAPAEDPAVIDAQGASEARRTAPYNLTGFPAHTVMAGFDPDGLPAALQIVTRPGEDKLALAIGAVLEATQPEVMARFPILGYA